ncbi:unnamed protein product [Agarophyton chilense]|eukprot:gb/GEZJ01003450.1/.p1 GENE.gb/GEZJ01003450.1/~~gb/GEZJ01003450.1/.p1  ORF type:complete len:476 (-),score=42.23 gb/GEZJ01003450.1/:903-2330(-)
MVVIPFGNGVVAAFVFLIFELFVFPFLFYSTSKMASMFLYWYAIKRNDVKVESMSFPLWSDGLMCNHLSHNFLLLIRILLIVIPVYLETKLIAIDDPKMILKTVDDALIPNPIDDWFEYQSKSGKHIRFLRHLSEMAYSHCTYSDDNGWIWARVANVTYVREDEHIIRCIGASQQLIFRQNEEIIDFNSESFRRKALVSISWTEGCARHFPETLLVYWVDKMLSNETAYRLRSLSIANATDLQCFFADSAKVRFEENLGPEWDVWCEKQDGQVVSYYYTRIRIDRLPVTDFCSHGGNIPKSGEGESKFLKQNGTVMVDLWFRESLEFKEKVLLGAEHLANSDPDNENPTLVRPSDIARTVLYTQKSNLTVSVPSGQILQHTEVEKVVIAIGLLEAVIVLCFATVFKIMWRWKWKYIQEPNTVDGLSRCWAESDENSYNQNWITLGIEWSSTEVDRGTHLVPVGIGALPDDRVDES